MDRLYAACPTASSKIEEIMEQAPVDWLGRGVLEPIDDIPMEKNRDLVVHFRLAFSSGKRSRTRSSSRRRSPLTSLMSGVSSVTS